MPTASSSTENCFSNRDSESGCGEGSVLKSDCYGHSMRALPRRLSQFCAKAPGAGSVCGIRSELRLTDGHDALIPLLDPRLRGDDLDQSVASRWRLAWPFRLSAT